LTGFFGLSEFAEQAATELAANAMLCAVNQAAYLLKRQLEKQGGEFVEKGGLSYMGRAKGIPTGQTRTNKARPTARVAAKR